MTQQFHSWVCIQKTEQNKKTISERYMHPSVHSSTIYNSQGMKATQVPINRLLA